ncbi:unnamed protein product [Paramecium sonneborni]|uniref:Uncharacterized protein n=1 Tax=Paramecium sonneborni TaxID=65129 RepID=A0A8S1RSP7_9CILI|nr:unnamed protein product [Paramecium sonneborni]
MKKQKQVQTLFKYYQSDEYEKKQEKKQIEMISYIKMNEELPIFELILKNCPTFVLDAQTLLLLKKFQKLIYLGINGWKQNRQFNYLDRQFKKINFGQQLFKRRIIKIIWISKRQINLIIQDLFHYNSFN